jgi:hypothetical protein
MEHRWSGRRFLGGEVTLSHPRYGIIHAVVRDISLGGMFVETGRVELPLNTPLAVSFRLQNGGYASHHRLHAMVVRTADDGAALMYLDSSADAIRPLRQMLYGPPGETAGTGAEPVWVEGIGAAAAPPRPVH